MRTLEELRAADEVNRDISDVIADEWVAAEICDRIHERP